MINSKRPLKARVSREEYQLLVQLRERKPAQNPPQTPISLGNRLSDKFASVMGSWRFIIIQSLLLILWLTLNMIGFIQHWDPYPFILLNLMLSFQSAYAAPIIMMSQNRQSDIDRQEARHDYEVNMKAELEIELLQDKINLLREEEIPQIVKILQEQQQQLKRLEELIKLQLPSENPTESLPE